MQQPPGSAEPHRKDYRQKLILIRGDVRDQAALQAALAQHAYTAVIHFSGLKTVGESVAQPMLYYDNNVVGSLCVIQAMQTCGVKTLVFSSSATVYREPKFLPYTEDHPLDPASPYGRSKLMPEQILRDMYVGEPDWHIAILRYLNRVGAHQAA